MFILEICCPSNSFEVWGLFESLLNHFYSVHFVLVILMFLFNLFILWASISFKYMWYLKAKRNSYEVIFALNLKSLWLYPQLEESTFKLNSFCFLLPFLFAFLLPFHSFFTKKLLSSSMYMNTWVEFNYHPKNHLCLSSLLAHFSNILSERSFEEFIIPYIRYLNFYLKIV